ncbi:MAG: 2-oxo acid dehydrogenase subunit E2 [Candidatus Moduliflexus flocculans]|nr:2-oxo acid dehydrogenase subunit E2 [Candidatus Moduliflexus flocculans]
MAANPRVNSVVGRRRTRPQGDREHRHRRGHRSRACWFPSSATRTACSLADQSRRSRDLADRARAGACAPRSTRAGPSRSSNIGMYGISSFTPIINPPQVGILGVGGDRGPPGPRARWQPGASPKMLHLCFTYDHRALDGAESSAFLAAVKDAPGGVALHLVI